MSSLPSEENCFASVEMGQIVCSNKLCDQHDIHPTMFYRWQKEFFENAAAAFEPRARRAVDAKDRRITLLEQKLQRKNEVLSELMEEHLQLKKILGNSERSLGFSVAS